MLIGSDDGIKVWLNGKKVHEVFKARAASYGEDVVKVHLRKGFNSLLVKLEERIGGWKFYLDFVDEKGNVLYDLKFVTAMPPVE